MFDQSSHIHRDNIRGAESALDMIRGGEGEGTTKKVFEHVKIRGSGPAAAGLSESQVMN
jgi:hypothetical protein